MNPSDNCDKRRQFSISTKEKENYLYHFQIFSKVLREEYLSEGAILSKVHKRKWLTPIKF